MADLLVRNIEDDVYERMKRAAASEGKSVTQAAREALARAFKPSKEELWALAHRIRAETRPSDIDSTQMIREDRDNDEPYR